MSPVGTRGPREQEDEDRAEVAYWDAHATAEDVWGETGTDYGQRVRDCLSVILPSLGDVPVHGLVVDLGCGIGRLAIPVARLHPQWRVVGVDISPVMATEFRQRSAGVGNCACVMGDGHRLPMTEPVAAAWSVVTFQHVPDDVMRSYLSSIGQSLVPSGRFRFQYVEGIQSRPLDHHRSEADVRMWCEDAGLEVFDVDRGLMYREWFWVTAGRA